MIKFENEEVVGWEHAIRGMRNPLNSWNKSDSGHECPMEYDNGGCIGCDTCTVGFKIGHNDQNLMKRLHDAGTDHRKFMRMLVVYVDITAPLYWWKEFDTYKVGTVANSCSTMHTIHKKEFTTLDFSEDHLLMGVPEKRVYDVDGNDITMAPNQLLGHIICHLNIYRDLYLKTKDKKYWWQMIQLLPATYNQKRTVMLNYEVLTNIYKSRKNHKLDEWRIFCGWVKTLPLADILVIDEEDFSDDNIKKFFNKVQKVDDKAFSYSVSKFDGSRKIVCIYNASGELRWGIDSKNVPSLELAYDHIKEFLENNHEQTRN